jgi:hypothetical protein
MAAWLTYVQLVAVTSHQYLVTLVQTCEKLTHHSQWS